MPDDAKMAWLADAACHGKTHLFFFNQDNREKGLSYPAFVARAQGICFSCPVLEPCREYARKYRETYGQNLYGVWAGIDFGTGDGKKFDHGRVPVLPSREIRIPLTRSPRQL